MTATDTTWSLAGLVRDAAEISDDASPEAIADIVLSKIPADAYRDVIKQILPRYVGICLHTQRLSNRQAVVKAGPSPRRDKMRELLAARLRESVHVGGGVWKFLADCTFDDLLSAANDRKRHAAENLAAAKVFEARAKAIREAGVGVFSELPAETLQRLLITEVAA